MHYLERPETLNRNGGGHLHTAIGRPLLVLLGPLHLEGVPLVEQLLLLVPQLASPLGNGEEVVVAANRLLVLVEVHRQPQQPHTGQLPAV